jgi:cytochrome P450
VTNLSATYSPFASPQLENPFPVWKQARDEQPVFFSEVLNAWVVTRYEDVALALRDHERFSSVGGSKPLTPPAPDVQAILDQVPDGQQMDVLTSDPPRHSRLRRFMQRNFTARRVSGLEGELRRLAMELIDAFAADRRCDFYTSFAHPYPLSAIGALLNLPRTDHDTIQHWVACNISLKWGSLEHDAHLAAAQGRVDFYRYCEALIDSRRHSPGADLLTAVVQDSDQSDDPLTGPEMVGQIMTFLTAGHETTANWLALAMSHLLEDRTRWEELCADRDRLDLVVEETLRYDGPAQTLWRTTLVDVELSGVTVPRGSRLGVVVGAADLDERVFEHPASFDLDRPTNRSHLQFGRGIHACVGAGLARLEGRVAFDVLAGRLPGLRLRDDGAMSFRPNAIQRVPRQLLIEWDAHDA